MPPSRAGVVVALAMGAASAAAWWRWMSSGPAPGPCLLTGAPAALFAAAMVCAGLAYLSALAAAAEPLASRHLWLALTIHLCAAPSPPFTSTDARMNLAYGRLAHVGLNPYEVTPRALPDGDPYRDHLDWPDAPNAWGPPITYVAWAAARVADPRLGLALFKLSMLLATLAAVGVAFALCRSRWPQDASRFFLLAGSPLLAWELSGQAHNDALVVLFASAFLLMEHTRRRAAALWCLAVAVLAKYSLLPLLGLHAVVLARESRRALATGAGLAAASAVALWSQFLGGSGLTGGLLQALSWAPSRAVNSLAAIAWRADQWLELPLFELWRALSQLSVVALGGWALSHATSATRLANGALVLLLGFQCLAAPSYWPWYATWLLPLTLVSDLRLARVTALFTAAAPALYLTGIPGGVASLLVHGATLALLARRVRRGLP